MCPAKRVFEDSLAKRVCAKNKQNSMRGVCAEYARTALKTGLHKNLQMGTWTARARKRPCKYARPYARMTVLKGLHFHADTSQFGPSPAITCMFMDRASNPKARSMGSLSRATSGFRSLIHQQSLLYTLGNAHHSSKTRTISMRGVSGHHFLHHKCGTRAPNPTP